MRLSCPPGSTAPAFKPPSMPHNQGGKKYEPVLHSPHLQQYQEQTQRLNGLYQISKNRNHRLLHLTLNLSRDINFLKEYCKCLEIQLEKVGFYHEKRFERLSRKQTADTIFQNYSDTSSLLEQWRSEENAQEQLIRLRNRNVNLQNENKVLHSRVGTESSLRLHKAIQVDTVNLEKIQKDYRVSQEKIGKLTSEISNLKHTNGALELEKHKRGSQVNVEEASRQVFVRIHELMRDYRKKLNALAFQKTSIQKKYRLLKENIRLTQTGSQLKLIDLLNQKVDILEKLVEKQQKQLQNTIAVYEGELDKIEDRRRQELRYFQNERIGLQSQNLRLCIDVQKALNRQDSTNLLLMQEKNNSERLSRDLVKLTQDIRSIELKRPETIVKVSKLKLQSGVIKFYGQNFKSMSEEIRLSCHSAGYQVSNNQNSNQSNFEYQFSEVSEGAPFMRRIGSPPSPEIVEGEELRHGGMEKIKITYNSYLAPGGTAAKNASFGRVYDSTVQYKRRLVQRKQDQFEKRS